MHTHTHTPHTVCRLDKSFFIQGFEWFDPGYRTYISCLLLDAYYSNPVLITFIRCVSGFSLPYMDSMSFSGGERSYVFDSSRLNISSDFRFLIESPNRPKKGVWQRDVPMCGDCSLSEVC
jgi:hypothetical protein